MEESRIIKAQDPRWSDTPIIEYEIKPVVQVTLTALIHPTTGDRQEFTNRLIGHFSSEEEAVKFFVDDAGRVLVD